MKKALDIVFSKHPSLKNNKDLFAYEDQDNYYFGHDPQTNLCVVNKKTLKLSGISPVEFVVEISENAKRVPIETE